MRHHSQAIRDTVGAPACVRGFTLIEAVMSILIVGLMLVAALNTIGASRLSQTQNAELATGPMLAQQLMAEILGQAYEEPIDTPVFGREGESGGDRVQWDDVDDYDGWSASPPESKDGTEIPDLAGWGREVEVKFVDIWDSKLEVALESGIKRIDVTVTHQNRVVTTLTGMRTTGWPEDSEEEQVAIRVLFVVANPASLTAKELGRQTEMESWGFTVTLIDDSVSQANIDAAILDVDAAYVSPNISGGALAHKLTGRAIGIVSEFPGKMDNFGICSSTSLTALSSSFSRTDALHYITEPFGGDPILVISTAFYTMPVPAGTLAPDLQTVAEAMASPALVALETGAKRYDGTDAPARRVHLPYNGAEVTQLTDDGLTLMKRSIEWAASMEQP